MVPEPQMLKKVEAINLQKHCSIKLWDVGNICAVRYDNQLPRICGCGTLKSGGCEWGTELLVCI